ncbi:hypothetical protein BKA67DRAFT_641728 [Truncatella angustata]|uniref:Uncharacterized protein n=1 Tax=Truncatella angustata TaxID=152316 RepID=A0A9P9A4V6_9PEZI|nr:uncharacterized protein BKA67DRAFT_641728 [Truncatella angustata]KAH6660665.1 hypothetical protein BKA67DRAFT_641728 [Truncatella angustata]KAH8199295.1 hypothetical protein TruAng_006531 [Truncatella angustata]
MSGIINKVKDALHKDKHEETPTGTAGPHGSRTANAADPRVDSDRDHRGNTEFGHTTGTHTGTHGVGATGTHTGTHGVGTTGTHTGTGAGYGTSGTGEGAHGPHSSRVGNAADPRVDSDLDGSRTVGNTHSTGTGAFGSTGTHTGAHAGTHGVGGTTHGTSGIGGTHTGTGYGTSGTGEGAHGPHSSRVGNAADPRVDSDLDGSRTVGNTHSTGTGAFGSTGTHTGSHTTGTHGVSGTTGGFSSGTTHGTHTGTAEGLHGPHSSRAANAADPRVDSDRDHRGTHATTHVGPADNTAGPHKSDILNKVDPRVDSDLDGSKTVGGNKTHAY